MNGLFLRDTFTTFGPCALDAPGHERPARFVRRRLRSAVRKFCPRLPGVYVVEGRGWQRRFAVTPVTEGESDLRRVTPTLTPPVGAPAAAAPADTPLAPALVVAALCLLMAEWWWRQRAPARARS